ncbi:unnamed protein product, partial [Ectocarpus sp. 12 AP-2014]
YHAIGFEGILHEDTAEFVHHLELTGWYGPPDCEDACFEWLDEIFGGDGSDSCDSEDLSSSNPLDPSSYSSSYITTYFERNNITLSWFCYNLDDTADIFTWTPGTRNLKLPDDVGFLFGNGSGG